jgi:hypothetical protein
VGGWVDLSNILKVDEEAPTTLLLSHVQYQKNVFLRVARDVLYKTILCLVQSCAGDIDAERKGNGGH